MMNVIDKAIELILPGVAVKRAAARQILEIQARGFDAAGAGRKRHKAYAEATGPNAAGMMARGPLRNIARDLQRNNPYAANGVRKFGEQIVGLGIVPRFESSNERARQRAIDVFSEWADRCEPEDIDDFYGQQIAAVENVVSDGDCLRVWTYDRQKGPFCEIREIDFLDESKNETARDGSGKRIVNGIELDGRGRRVAYHLFDDHPGDWGMGGGMSLKSRRIDARFVDHIFRRQRSGQMLGWSGFAPVARALQDYHDLTGAMLERRMLETFLALVVKRSSGAAGPGYGTVTGAADSTAGGAPLEEIASGQITYLRENEELQNVQISSPGDSMEFGKLILHGVAAGLGLPYHMLTGDVSEANYTSQRAALINFGRTLDVWQGKLMTRQFCRTAWARLVEWEIAMNGNARGRLDDVNPIWTPPARAVVDPKKDMEALTLELEAGLKSYQDAITQLGRDPRETLEEQQKWAELGGLSLGTLKTKKAAPDAAQNEDKDE